MYTWGAVLLVSMVGPESMGSAAGRCVCIDIHMYACMYVSVYACIHMYTYANMYLYKRSHICKYVYMGPYILCACMTAPESCTSMGSAARECVCIDIYMFAM